MAIAMVEAEATLHQLLLVILASRGAAQEVSAGPAETIEPAACPEETTMVVLVLFLAEMTLEVALLGAMTLVAGEMRATTRAGEMMDSRVHPPGTTVHLRGGTTTATTASPMRRHPVMMLHRQGESMKRHQSASPASRLFLAEEAPIVAHLVAVLHRSDVRPLHDAGSSHGGIETTKAAADLVLAPLSASRL